MKKMADPIVILDDAGEVMRMTNEEGDPKISQVMEARDSKGNPEEDSSSDFECIIELSEEDLALEFVKLSASDKIRYNEWFNFHTKYQRSMGIGGSVSQIIRNISNQNKPLIPEEIPRREFEEVDIDPDQVQIECMVDKDGREVKKVKPILIKKELMMNYATQVPFDIDSDEEFFFFTDEERIPYADHPYEPKIEEETDDEDYVDDDVSIVVDSDSSDALSMLDENFEDTDPVKLDDALQQIVTGLRQVADGFEALKNLLPTVPVTDVAKIVQAAPTPYLQPMSKAAVQALQTLGEEDLINHACLTEFQKGVSQAALMRRYDVGRDCLYKILHGKTRPGGTQYQTLKREDVKVKTEPRGVQGRVLRGRGRGRTTILT